MIQVRERQKDRIFMQISGTVTRDDYIDLVPQLNKMIEDHGTLRALVEIENLKGWTPPAMIDELQFDIRHRNDVARCAVVGESKTQMFLTRALAPFFGGKVRFFTKERLPEAKEWMLAS